MYMIFKNRHGAPKWISRLTAHLLCNQLQKPQIAYAIGEESVNRNPGLY